jgi:serine/threonine-protein kinase
LNVSDIIEGRYRLERLLGTGGMAEVWLAEDQRLRRWVAVKVLREAFSAESDAETIAAFEREATVIARLQHPSIVAVYDTGVHDGRRFIVMEYVHGYSLRQMLESQGRLTEQEAVRYGAQVAAALHYAHSQGVIHCDIKPENVLISENGTAKVADFGVAETLTRTMAPGQAQDLLGTIAYLAPEIIEGSEPSPGSDIYSLGLTVFELVAGRPPFGGSTAGQALGQRLATPAPRLRTFARGASPELEEVLARALALSPRDRYPSAGAFAAALQRVPQATARPRAPVAAPPGSPPQLGQRHTTARIRRTAAASPPTGGVRGSTILMAAGVVLAALGVGVAVALLLSRIDDNDGGTPPSPTPGQTATVAPTKPGEPSPTRTAAPTATTTPQPSPSPTQGQATPTRTPTPQQQPTQTPIQQQSTATPTPPQGNTPAPSPTTQ